MICLECLSKECLIKKEDFKPKALDKQGKPIIIKNVTFIQCKKCTNQWIDNKEFKRIQKEVANKT